MKSPITNKLSNQSLKIVVVAMAFVVLGSLFYIYKMSDRSKNIILALRTEKASTLKELREAEAKLEKVVYDNSALSKLLKIEKFKIGALIQEIQKSDPEISGNLKFVKQAQNLQKSIANLTNQLNDSRKKLDSVKVILKDTEVEKISLFAKNKKLQTNNEDLNLKISEAMELTCHDIKVVGLKDRGDGDYVETLKARRIDLLKVSFFISPNKLTTIKSKKYFIQIIDFKNNVLGLKQTIFFEDKELVYSAINSVQYDNKSTKVITDIAVNNLEQGTYTINVFDKSSLILTYYMDLK